MTRFNRHIVAMPPLPQGALHQNAIESDGSDALTLDRPADNTQRNIRSILVPLDGSLTAEHALPHALSIASRAGATIRLIHVHSRLDHVEPWQMSLSHETMERRKRVKRDYLREIARRIARASDVSLKLTLVDSPDIEATLRQAAVGSDLLVMASARRGFFRRLWAPSIVKDLRRHLQSPLLLVRGYPYPVDLTGDPIPEHILVPLDGSASSESIIAPATTIGRLNDTALTLLNVQQNTWTSDSLERMVPHSYLESIADRLKSTLSSVDTRILPVDGSIGSAVAEYAQKCMANWIAIGTRRDGGLRRLVRGSIADKIVRKTNVPVLMTGTDIDSTSGVLAIVG